MLPDRQPCRHRLRPDRKAFWVWLALALLLLFFDQGSKALIVGLLEPWQQIEVLSVFSLVLVYNTGAAFSLLSDAGGWQRWFFVLVGTGVSLYLLKELWTTRLRQESAAYALILGGAWGNLWDRLTSGRVVDFLLLHYQGHYFPAFNLADTFICIGFLLWIWLAISGRQSAEP